MPGHVKVREPALQHPRLTYLQKQQNHTSSKATVLQATRAALHQIEGERRQVSRLLITCCATRRREALAKSPRIHTHASFIPCMQDRPAARLWWMHWQACAHPPVCSRPRGTLPPPNARNVWTSTKGATTQGQLFHQVKSGQGRAGRSLYLYTQQQEGSDSQTHSGTHDNTRQAARMHLHSLCTSTPLPWPLSPLVTRPGHAVFASSFSPHSPLHPCPHSARRPVGAPLPDFLAPGTRRAHACVFLMNAINLHRPSSHISGALTARCRPRRSPAARPARRVAPAP